MKEKKIMIAWLTMVFIIIDQFSKIFIIENYEFPTSYGIFQIEVVKNTGIAFSANEGNVKNIILEIFILAIIIKFIANQIKILNKSAIISVSMILSGGMSNLIDRLLRKRSNRLYKN